MSTMNYTRWQWIIIRGTLALIILAMLLAPPFAISTQAHGGGTPRLTNVEVGPYRLYAWSQPEPWRVGEVHLSLAVTKPNPDTSSNQVELPVTDVDVLVTYTAMKGGTVDTTIEPIIVPALRQEFLSDFYYEADPILAHESDWQITVDVTGPEGSGSTQFMMETLPAHTLNWTLIASAGGVLVLILGIIAIWSRSQQSAQPARPRRRASTPEQASS